MRRIVGVSGWKRHGKDVVGDVFVGQGFARCKYAEPVYDGLLAVNPFVFVQGSVMAEMAGWRRLSEVVEMQGWEWAKDNVPEVRRLLQRYGTEGGREIHGWDCWVDAAWRDIAAHHADRDIVFTDVRFQNEAEAIIDRGGEIWRVVRPGAPVPGPDAHVSETALNDWPFDVVIRNDSDLPTLHTKVRKELDWMT